MRISKRQFRLTLLIVIMICIFDLLTKWATVLWIPEMGPFDQFYPYGGVPVFRNFLGIEFSLGHIHNEGAAWGIFGEFSTYLLLVRMIFVCGLIVYLLYWRYPAAYYYPLTLVIAGALGNILDFLLYGHVIDMFHFVLWGWDYPLFNIADSSIFVGMIWLILHMLFTKDEQEGNGDSKRRHT